MQRRPYGNTGEELSIIAMGGIVVMGVDQSEADRTTREAFDRGINYFDVAPSYGDAEERLGPALQPFRDQAFLACKTTKRAKEEAAEELRASLKRLRTDHFDLYQLHAVSSIDEANTCLGLGGALEAFLEARDAGLIRYVGFSAHSAEAAVKLLEQFPFDSVLFPFNYTTYYQARFGPQVMEAARKRGAARLALKAMARRPWPEGADKSACKNCWYEPQTDPAEAELALRWTLSLPMTAAVPPGDPALFRMALEFAERFKPLTDEERAVVEGKAVVEKPLFALAGVG
jgi:aryl-alcohol dehydrogenase-like predicted oxidoreductase